MARKILSRLRLPATIMNGRLKGNLSLKVGGLIVLVYLVISLLDVVYPEYIGVKYAFNLVTVSNPQIQSVSIALPSPPTLSKGILFIFGTTAYKIPILSAILAAIPVDLTFAAFIAGISALIGVFLGVTFTYFSKKLELLLTSVVNVFISFPLLISVMIFGLLVGFNLTGLVVGITFILWAYYAQLARMLTLNIKNTNFIEASRASGASGFRIVYSHIIPNILTPVLVRFSTDLATVIVIFSAANFMFYSEFASMNTLPELGSLLAGFPSFGLVHAYRVGSFQSYQPLTSAVFLVSGYWWTVFFPVLFLLILVIGLITFSDGLRKAIDPRTGY